MAPRCLKRIAQLPEHQRFSVLSEGLELLADNVITLDHDAHTLGAYRGAAVLRTFADEEAAKVAILLDLARAGWQDHAAVNACMQNFYSHLARGVYVRAYDISPAHLAEVREYVDNLRQEYYLDGPMEVDWIYDNEILTSREQRLYVDYIQDEDGDLRWTGPVEPVAMVDAAFNSPVPSSAVVRLVAAMRRIGLLTEDGLAAIRAVWDDVDVKDCMHWAVLRPRNEAVIKKLSGDRQDFTEEDGEAVDCILKHWSFPLTSLDLRKIEVNLSDSRRKRERLLAHEMGVDDGLDGECGNYV